MQQQRACLTCVCVCVCVCVPDLVWFSIGFSLLLAYATIDMIESLGFVVEMLEFVFLGFKIQVRSSCCIWAYATVDLDSSLDFTGYVNI
jgi:hypothetical protein